MLEAEDVEGAIGNAVSLGGDSGTIAGIAGDVAQAICRVVPEPVTAGAHARLPGALLVVINACDRC